MGSFTERGASGAPLLRQMSASPPAQRQLSNTSAQGVVSWDVPPPFAPAGPGPPQGFYPAPPVHRVPSMTRVLSLPAFTAPGSGVSFTGSVHGGVMPVYQPPMQSVQSMGGGIGGIGRNSNMQQYQRGSKKNYPFFVKVLNLFGPLVFIVNAPVAIWFSYYLFYQATLLVAGPLAGLCSLAAIFGVHWGHRCGCLSMPERMVKIMKFLCMAALAFDVVGVVVVPLVMYSVICPDDQVDNCEHDKPIGQAASVAAAFVMVIHAVLCVLLRMQAKHVVGGMCEGYQTDDQGVMLPRIQSMPFTAHPPSLGYHSFPTLRSPSLTRHSMGRMSGQNLPPYQYQPGPL